MNDALDQNLGDNNCDDAANRARGCRRDRLGQIEEGRPEGRHLDHWLRAEAEMNISSSANSARQAAFHAALQRTSRVQR
jgi:hypothetical protein